MEIYKIECVVSSSYVPFLIDDMFSNRYLCGWGNYDIGPLRDKTGRYEFHWASSKAGHEYFLRQTSASEWYFRAIFPEGSHDTARRAHEILCFYKYRSMNKGIVGSIVVFPFNGIDRNAPVN